MRRKLDADSLRDLLQGHPALWCETALGKQDNFVSTGNCPNIRGGGESRGA